MTAVSTMRRALALLMGAPAQVALPALAPVAPLITPKSARAATPDSPCRRTVLAVKIRARAPAVPPQPGPLVSPTALKSVRNVVMGFTSNRHLAWRTCAAARMVMFTTCAITTARMCAPRVTPDLRCPTGLVRRIVASAPAALLPRAPAVRVMVGIFVPGVIVDSILRVRRARRIRAFVRTEADLQGRAVRMMAKRVV